MRAREAYVVMRSQGEYSDRTVEVIGVRLDYGQAIALAESHRRRETEEENAREVALWAEDAETVREWRGEWHVPNPRANAESTIVLRDFGSDWGYRGGTYWIERHTTQGTNR
jgi:hypothetical protein